MFLATDFLQHSQEGHQVFFLLVIQLQGQHKVEEFDGAVQCQQTIVVQVGRGAFNPAHWEGFDRAVCRSFATIDHTFLEEAAHP